jgi:hypothetical protein
MSLHPDMTVEEVLNSEYSDHTLGAMVSSITALNPLRQKIQVAAMVKYGEKMDLDAAIDLLRR